LLEGKSRNKTQPKKSREKQDAVENNPLLKQKKKRKGKYV